MSVAASQIWCHAPNLRTRKSFKLLRRACSSSSRSRSRQPSRPLRVVKASQRPTDSTVEQSWLLQNSSTATNTVEQEDFSLASSTPADVPPVLRIDDVLTKRRITLARLVKGVYELEWRRLQGISFEKSPAARSWWGSVQYDLVRTRDFELDRIQQQRSNKSIDLAVYKWNASESRSVGSPAPICPPVVIAIRGTLPNVEDGWHNFHGSLQRLHLTPRYREILAVVKDAVESHGSDQVCITGHSLGAALGLIVARTLAVEEGIRIESHLFNPIYSYSWIPTAEQLLNRKALWQTVRVARCATVAGLASLFMDEASRRKIAKEYAQLRDWSPHVYINTGDPICRGYWEYFTNHERLARSGAVGAYVAHLAAPFSGRGLLTVSLGSRPSHLIPSATLHLCEGQVPTWFGTDFRDRSRYMSHSLGTWMTEDLPTHSRAVRLSSW